MGANEGTRHLGPDGPVTPIRRPPPPLGLCSNAVHCGLHAERPDCIFWTSAPPDAPAAPKCCKERCHYAAECAREGACVYSPEIVAKYKPPVTHRPPVPAAALPQPAADPPPLCGWVYQSLGGALGTCTRPWNHDGQCGPRQEGDL